VRRPDRVSGGPREPAGDQLPPNRVKALVKALTHVAEVLVEAQRQDKPSCDELGISLAYDRTDRHRRRTTERVTNACRRGDPDDNPTVTRAWQVLGCWVSCAGDLEPPVHHVQHPEVADLCSVAGSMGPHAPPLGHKQLRDRPAALAPIEQRHTRLA
jgi:hypothetical protein